ncbi:MAG: dihydroorotate dehydrogenase, partial [Actinomycetota bacterium]
MTVDCSVALGPLVLPGPIVTASGTFGHGAELARLCPPERLGAVTTKSVAVFATNGNPAPRVTGAAGGGMLNSVGLPGPGIDEWMAGDLPDLEAHGARIIASIWGHSVDDYEAAAAALFPVCERIVAIEVNLSCPNVKDHAHVFAHDAEPTAAATAAVVGVLAGRVPVFAKLSPNVTDLAVIAGAALGVDHET